MELPNFLKTVVEDNTPLEEQPSKIRFDLIPATSLLDVASAFTAGVEKHSPYGWKGRDKTDYLSAALRHINEYQSYIQGSTADHLDPETNLSVLAHAAADLLILMALEREGTCI